VQITLQIDLHCETVLDTLHAVFQIE